MSLIRRRIVFSAALGFANWLALLSVSNSHAAPIAVEEAPAGAEASFEKDVLPTLRKNCLACHSASERQGELILESPETILKGGESGPAVVAGKSAESLIFLAASHAADSVMPPEGNDVAAANLTPKELGLLKRWIDSGAKADAAGAGPGIVKWRPLPPGVHPTLAVALSRDGQVAACSRANRIYLYHVPTGDLIAQLDDPALSTADGGAPGIAHRDLVQSLAFDSQGELLASGGFREAKIWRRPRDVERLKVEWGGPIAVSAVSPDATRIAIADVTGKVRIYAAADGAVVAETAGHAAEVKSLAFSGDGTLLASASVDGAVRLWRAADGTAAGMVHAPVGVNAVTFVRTAAATPEMPSPPETLVTGGEENLIRTWDVPTESSTKLASPLAPAALAVFSQDRTLLATATAEGKVRVARVASPDGAPLDEEVATLQVEGGVASMAFFGPTALPAEAPAPDAAALSLAIATKQGQIQVIPLADPTAVRQWRGGSEALNAISATTAGDWVATGAGDGSIDLWRTTPATPAVPDAFTGRAAESLLVSPSRKLVLSVGLLDGKRTATIWDAAIGKARQTIATADAAGALFAISANETRVASVGADGALKTFDLTTPEAKELSAYPAIAQGAVGLALHPEGTQALLAFPDGTLKLVNLTDGVVASESKGHTAPALAVGFRQGQTYSVGRDRTVRFWNTADGAQVRAIDLPAAPTAFAMSADENRLAFVLEDGKARVVNAADGGAPVELLGLTKPAKQIAFSPDATRIVACADAGEVRIWDAATGRTVEAFTETGVLGATYLDTNDRLLVAAGDKGILDRPLRFVRRIEGSTQPVLELAFTANGQRLYSLAKDGTLRAHEVATGNQALTTGHGAPVLDLSLSHDEAALATAGENNQVRLWRNDGGQLGVGAIGNLPGPPVAVAYFSDATRIAVAIGGATPQTQVYDVATGALLERLLEPAEPALALASYSDKRLVAAAPSASVRSTMRAFKTIPGHGAPVTALAADPVDAMRVWSGSRDATVRRWSMENGQADAQFNHGAPVTGIAIHPTGQRLAASGDNGTIRLWNRNTQQIAEMRGDIRLKNAHADAQRHRNASNSRQELAKRLLDEAEKDVPVKTEADRKIAETLAAANKDVADKTAALETLKVAKTAAEKAAIDASSASKLALAAKEQAENEAKLATEAVRVAQEKMARLQQVAASLGDPTTMQPRLDQAKAEVEALQQAVAQKTAAIQAPTQAATTAATAADEAAKKVAEALKPYSEALAALGTAAAAQNLAAQQNAIAARELKEAQDLVPVRKQEVTEAEAALKAADEALAAADLKMKEAEKPVRSIAFSPDGETLITGGDFGSVHAWDGETGVALAAYAGHAAPISAVAFAGDDAVVSASADGTLRVWVAQPAWKLERTIGSVDDPSTIVHRVTAVDFSSDSQRLLVGSGVPSRSGELAIFRVADGVREFHLPEAHSDVIYSARLSPDGRRIASCGADKYLRSFDIAAGTQIRRYEGHTNYVLGVDWKSDGRILASAGADASVKVWDAATGDQERTIDQGYAKHVTAIRFLADRDEFVTSGGDKRVRMRNSANGGDVRNFPEAQAWLHAVDVTPDGTVVAAGDAQGRLYLFNGQNGQPLHVLEPPAEGEAEATADVAAK